MKTRHFRYDAILALVVVFGVTGVNHANAVPLSGTANLLCDIPDYADGTNVVSNIVGTGIAFSALTSPLINPTLVISGPGLAYTFNATLAAPTSANIGGVGDGT